MSKWDMFKLSIKFSFMRLLEYKLDSILVLLSTAFSPLMTLLFYYGLFFHIKTFAGWTFNEMMFFTMYISLVLGFTRAFTNISIRTLSSFIRRGRLDMYLTKPLSPLVHMLIVGINIKSIGNFLTSFALFLYFGFSIGAFSTLDKILVFILLFISSIIAYFSLTLIFASLSFITISSRTVRTIFRLLDRISKYPLDIYPGFIYMFFVIVFPISFAYYFPVQIFLHHNNVVLAYISPFISTLLLYTALRIWNLGLKAYYSTGT